MWPLDGLNILSQKVQTQLQKNINEGFGPVASIATSIGSTIGAVTGGVNESKKLAEQQAAVDAKVEAQKKADADAAATKEEEKNATSETVKLDTSGNIVVREDDPVSLALLITKYILTVVFGFFFAMLVANQLIFLPRTIRLLIFILILVVPYILSPIALLPFAVYYIGLMLWRVYLRSTPEYEGKKLSLLPKIYCMLPLTTVEGTTSFARFFKYPFYFPKSEGAERRLQNERVEYENDLKANFYKWDEIVQKYPEFGKKFNELSDQFKELITPILAPSQQQVVAATDQSATPAPSAPPANAEQVSVDQSEITK